MKRIIGITGIGLACLGAYAEIVANGEKELVSSPRQVEILIQVLEVTDSGEEMLAAPRVTTPLGKQATIHIVQEVECPDGGREPVGIILQVTPTSGQGVIHLAGSAIVSEALIENTNGDDAERHWISFQQLKVRFSIDIKNSENSYLVGPVERTDKDLHIRLGAREVFGDRVTNENFERVSVGMTMAEVVAALGEPAGFMSYEDVGGEPTGVKTKHPMWDWPGYTISTSFSEDGKLTHKQLDNRP